jgi:hypothetical protein
MQFIISESVYQDGTVCVNSFKITQPQGQYWQNDTDAGAHDDGEWDINSNLME